MLFLLLGGFVLLWVALVIAGVLATARLEAQEGEPARGLVLLRARIGREELGSNEPWPDEPRSVGTDLGLIAYRDATSAALSTLPSRVAMLLQKRAVALPAVAGLARDQEGLVLEARVPLGVLAVLLVELALIAALPLLVEGRAASYAALALFVYLLALVGFGARAARRRLAILARRAHHIATDRAVRVLG